MLRCAVPAGQEAAGRAAGFAGEGMRDPGDTGSTKKGSENKKQL